LPLIERGKRPGATKAEREAGYQAEAARKALMLWAKSQAGMTGSVHSILRELHVSPTTFKRRMAHAVRLIKQGLVDDGLIVVPPIFCMAA